MGVERLLQHEALGQAGGRMAPDGQPLAEQRGVRDERVSAQRGLGGIIDLRQKCASLLVPQLFPPPLREPDRHRVKQGGRGRITVVEACQERVAVAGGLAQNRIDQPRATRAEAFRKPDTFVHRRVRRHAGVQELEQPDPDGGENRRLQPPERATGQALGHVIQREASLHRAVGDRLCQRAVPGPKHPGLGREGAIGVRALLKDAAHHLERAPASRAYLR